MVRVLLFTAVFRTSPIYSSIPGLICNASYLGMLITEKPDKSRFSWKFVAFFLKTLILRHFSAYSIPNLKSLQFNYISPRLSHFRKLFLASSIASLSSFDSCSMKSRTRRKGFGSWFLLSLSLSAGCLTASVLSLSRGIPRTPFLQDPWKSPLTTTKSALGGYAPKTTLR